DGLPHLERDRVVLLRTVEHQASDARLGIDGELEAGNHDQHPTASSAARKRCVARLTGRRVTAHPEVAPGTEVPAASPHDHPAAHASHCRTPVLTGRTNPRQWSVGDPERCHRPGRAVDALGPSQAQRWITAAADTAVQLAGRMTPAW